MPIYGDPILAHTDTDRGTSDSSFKMQVRSNRADAPRYLQTIWGDKGINLTYNALIKATGEDKPGALADLASVFAKLNINISNVYTKDLDERFTEFNFEANVGNTKELKKVDGKDTLNQVHYKVV